MPSFSRRQFIAMSMGAAATMMMPRFALSAVTAKTLSFYHMHTAESLRITYAERGRYLPAAISELRHYLRDWRTGESHPIDVELLDQLYALQQRVENSGVYHVVCGYRLPRTNAMLHARSSGVASRSLHLEGRAIDISLPGVELAHLHKAALSLQAGGVGYYPASDFIHIDTGRVRQW